MRAALVLGGAACVWSDIHAALEIGEFAGVVTCNDVTSVYPGPIDACASLHPSKWPRWLIARDRNGLERPARVFGHIAARKDRIGSGFVTDYTGHKFEGQDRTGSSGLFALKVALEDLEFDRAVLCGVPMTAHMAHYFDAAAWEGASSHQNGFTQAVPALAGRARSMSGWTADLLGRPDEHWLTA